MRCPLLLLPLLAVSVASTPVGAQSAEADVLAVVERLFDGMRAGDTTAMRATLHPEARLTSTGLRDGAPLTRAVPIAAWLAAVAASDEVLDERLYDTEVRVAGGLATVWTYYTLHVGDRFSHCGHDAFQLVRTNDGWRILQVTDTRREEGCTRTERPPAGAVPVEAPGYRFSEIEDRLARGRFELTGIQDNRWDGDRTQRAMLRFPDGTTLRVKWARAAVGGSALNNEPRYELAAYRIQKLFLEEEDWVVPPTVVRSMPLEVYRQLDPDLEPTFEGTRSVLVTLQYWLDGVESLDTADVERAARDERYARRLGQLNLLTYLIRHADSNSGNILISTGTDPRMFAVDNGVAFRSPESPRGTAWMGIRTERLPADAVARIRGWTREQLDDALAVVAQFRVRSDGRLVAAEPAGRMNPHLGADRQAGTVQLGLTQRELDELWARRADLLARIDRDELMTF